MDRRGDTIYRMQETPSGWPQPIEPEPDRIGRGVALLLVLGFATLMGAGIAYVVESSGSSGLFDDPPNWAPAQFLLGAGAYLLLLGVILVAGRRR